MTRRNHSRSIAHRTLHILGAALLLSMSAGCSPLHGISVLSSNFSQDRADFTYQAEKGLKLAVFTPDTPEGSRTPRQAGAEGAPVILFFYGGSWQSGSRSQYRFVGSEFSAAGFVTVVPDYRLYPDVVFPEFMTDATDALKWTLANIADHGGDPSRVFLAGHSAGAHIAALMHLDARYLKAANLERRHCGFIGISGPYDFAPLMGPLLNSIFPAGTHDDSQPIRFVTGNEGPSLLLHGLQDKTVKPRGSQKLADKLRAAGAHAELEIYPKRGHADLLLAMSRPMGRLAPVTARIEQFVDDTHCSKMSDKP